MKRNGLLALLLWLPCALAAVASDGPAPGAAIATEGETEAGIKEHQGPFLGGFLRETRVIYPLQHQGWEAKGEQLYPDQALGASVRYADKRHPDRWIDLYFYPAGVLDAKAFAEALQGERQMLQAAVRPDGYSAMEVGDTQSFSYRRRATKDGKGDRAAGYSLDLHAVRDGRALNSAMTLQLDNLYFVKGRMSVPEGSLSRKRTRRLLEDFVGRLAPRLTVVSSGGCWRPLPIEAMTVDALSQPHLLTMATEGRNDVVVTRDRVLATDPDGPQAKVAMFMGMSMTNRVVEGCQAAEDLNQPVPEDMRELRLEYSAPDEDRATPPARLHPDRVGRG